MRVRLVAALSAVLMASMPAALVRGQAETQREPAIAQYQKVSEHLDWFGAKELEVLVRASPLVAPHPADINGFVSGFDDRFYERSVMG